MKDMKRLFCFPPFLSYKRPQRIVKMKKGIE